MRRLLIANRGEIACRIGRTARRMGMTVIAVHSDADAGAVHARDADEAVRIGPAPAALSYLNVEAILRAARDANADAVHPGYGFLSENAGFARAACEAGLIFVGPSAEAIALMGDKRAAKALARSVGVAVIAGDDGLDNQSDENLAGRAAAIGFPLMIKAASGGGGRGMRIVRGAAEFPPALASARREARSAFGDDAILLEKLIEAGRHVEVQVFGDRFGNVVHLFERDCTAQRRHQKIIEEAPSPVVDEALRTRLGQWATTLARAASYENAGTVEFILDSNDQPYFLEMNTRLQVEHPVTEMVTGLDLVEWQLRIARGEKLPLAQHQITLRGHAIEARLYAEDPAREFLPQTGRVRIFRPADASGNGRRIDAGVAQGDSVNAYYDPMIAKYVAHGSTRQDACQALIAMLDDAPIVGVDNNAGFLVRLLGSAEFEQARMTTGTIDGWGADRREMFATPDAAPFDFICCAAALALAPGGDWFRTSGHDELPIDLECAGISERVVLEIAGGRIVRARTRQLEIAFDAVSYGRPWLAIARGGRSERHRIAVEGAIATLLRSGFALTFREPDLLAPKPRQADPRRLVAPVSGLAIAISVKIGDRVAIGQAVATVEAMKMETRIAAQSAGTVTAVHVAAGSQVVAGAVIAEIDPDLATAGSGNG